MSLPRSSHVVWREVCDASSFDATGRDVASAGELVKPVSGERFDFVVEREPIGHAASVARYAATSASTSAPCFAHTGSPTASRTAGSW